MKSIKSNLLLLLTVVAFFVACGHGGNHAQAEDSYAFTAAYICPMHCDGSGAEAPGKCPSCKMDYVQNEKQSTDGHEGHDHEGHDHGGHDHSGHDHSGHNH